MRNCKLSDTGERHAHQPQQHSKIQSQVPGQDPDALRAFQQSVELVCHSDAAPGERRQGGTRDPQLGERSPTEDQERVEHQVDDVRYPKQPHGNCGVARAPKNCVVQKQHQHHAAATECDARVSGAE